MVDIDDEQIIFLIPEGNVLVWSTMQSESQENEAVSNNLSISGSQSYQFP